MVNQIVAVGSVDGVLTGAAALRLFPEAAIEFTQAFMVDKLTPENWQSNRQVLFVDLAVNNQYEEMTIQFVTRVINSGHRIVGVNDEHDASAWQRVFDATGLEISNLIVGPCSQKEEGNHQSSGALLAATFSLDEHGKELCAAADEADHGNFSSHFASLANEAVKSNIGDNSRRVYLAEHFLKAENLTRKYRFG